jgi:ABC-2 type transport system permease protein
VINGALAKYLKDCAFQQPPYTNSREFVDRLYEAVPEKYDYLVEDFFEKIVLYDNRTKKARAAQREDGGWTVTLDIESIKYQADEDGAESEAPMNDWIEIGVFGEDSEGEETELYREFHQLQSGPSTLTIEVDEDPKRAGIDPTVLLVDRNPDDNVRKITKR